MNAFAEAAATVMKAGVDGVECMFAYDMLIDQFMDPKRNQRTDGYGGPLANRCRLAVMVLNAIRASIGAEAILGIRVTAAMQEYVEAVDHRTSECDIDYVGVGNGNYESLHLTIPPMEVEVGVGIAASAVRRGLAGSRLPEGRVVVLDSDGHRKGAGTAEWLAESGRSVALVSLTPSPAYMLDSSKVGPLALVRLRDLGGQVGRGPPVGGHRSRARYVGAQLRRFVPHA